jgi:hypothetical protein
MLDFLSPSNFDFFARFFLSGFIIFSVRSRYVFGEKPKATEVIFESIILSLLNQLVFLILAPSVSYLSGFLPVALVETTSALSGGRTAFFAEILVLPALLGVLFGAVLRRGWNSAILRSCAVWRCRSCIRPGGPTILPSAGKLRDRDLCRWYDSLRLFRREFAGGF